MATPVEQIALPQTQLAKAIGVSTRTIHRWEKRGLLKGHRVGGVKLYPVDKVKELVGR
jgi:DNA-binding transcriptional MerR regulator